MEKKLVLFVCTGNTCRSPLAEALFNKYAAEKGIPYTAGSAGVCVKYPSEASENTVIAGKELGVDLSAHRSRQVDVEILSKAALIVCMNERHKTMLGERFGGIADKAALISDGGIADPYGMSLGVYRAMAADMDKAVKRLVEKLSREA